MSIITRLCKRLKTRVSRMRQDKRNEIADVFIVDKSYNRMLRFYRWDRADNKYEICCDGPDMEKFLNAIPAVIPYNYYLVLVNKDGSCDVCITLACYKMDMSPTEFQQICVFNYETRRYEVRYNKQELEQFLKDNFVKKNLSDK